MNEGAGVLRVAAAAMRAKADAVARPWRPYSDKRIPERSGTEAWQDQMRDYLGGEWGDYAASMHPAVAHAVADWLYVEAERWDINFAATQSPSIGIDHPGGIHQGDPEAAAKGADYHARHALAVARAFMGGTPDTEGDAS